MKILYGTTNKAKLNAMRNATDRLGIELIGLKDLDCELPLVKEDGKTPLENAKIKAEAYYKAFGMPVFSCDSGLYFEGVDEEDQPGIFVRRVGGKELNDDEMIAHYGRLAEKYGGSLIARYYNSVHFILDDNTSFSCMDISLASDPFALVTEPHPKRVEGFPLDSLSKDIATDEYYYDLETKDISTDGIVDGYYKFFSEALKHNF
jgi:8-oxo-dGTP diphosphatase